MSHMHQPGYLRHIHACNRWQRDSFIPFMAGEQQLGMVRPAFAESLRDFADTFIVSPDCLKLHPALNSFELRNQAMAAVLDKLVEKGVLDHLMGEPFPVMSAWGQSPALLIDRTATSLFGIRSFGQHLNGIVLQESGLAMWIGRRAADRYSFPDQLDQMVAGGLPFGISLDENLAKECEEEAGMAAMLAAEAVPTGSVSYSCETNKGLRRDTIFCYDIILPAGFTPRCTDGEVAEFFLWSLEEVARVVRETDKFKPNCNLVVIDFLLRHGRIEARHPEYSDLIAGLRSIPSA